MKFSTWHRNSVRARPDRLLAFLDPPLDDPIAHDHAKAVDGGGVRKREDVYALEPLLGGIVEALGDGGPGEQACDADAHLGLENRGGQEHPFELRSQQQAALLGVLQAHRWTELGLGFPRRQADR